MSEAKKLVLILAIFALVTKANKKNNVVLVRIPYIYYPLRFCKAKKNKVLALINSNSKVNAMTLAYTLKLGLKVRCINIRA